MFHRYHNLRRAVGLLSVLLALSSTAQQTRILCVVAGCSPVNDCEEEVHQGTCPHSCSNCKTQNASLFPCKSRVPCGTSHGSRDDSLPTKCPCPDSCWCHQSPEPFELPKTPSQSHELLLTGVVCTDGTIASMPYGDQSARKIGLAALGSSTATSVQFCSELCRFLI